MFSPPDKTNLGNRYVCYECSTKFYDLNKPEPLCPECGADQRNAPVRDLKALLGSGKTPKPTAEEAPELITGDEDDDDDDLADDLGDDDDDDGDEDEDE